MLWGTENSFWRTDVFRSYVRIVHIFRRVRKIAKSDHQLPSARMEQLGSHWTDLHEV